MTQTDRTFIATGACVVRNVTESKPRSALYFYQLSFLDQYQFALLLCMLIIRTDRFPTYLGKIK